jgi:hypothetical protein
MPFPALAGELLFDDLKKKGAKEQSLPFSTSPCLFEGTHRPEAYGENLDIANRDVRPLTGVPGRDPEGACLAPPTGSFNSPADHVHILVRWMGMYRNLRVFGEPSAVDGARGDWLCQGQQFYTGQEVERRPPIRLAIDERLTFSHCSVPLVEP